MCGAPRGGRNTRQKKGPTGVSAQARAWAGPTTELDAATRPLPLLRRASPCDVSAVAAAEARCAPLATVLLAKLRSSACGAISVSGGLAPALWDLWFSGAARGRVKAGLNLAIHAYLAYSAYWFLPGSLSLTLPGSPPPTMETDSDADAAVFVLERAIQT